MFTVVTDDALRSTDGRPLGVRGLRTRQRILDVIASLIEQHGLRGLKLEDVATEVGFSQPAFYQYFRDLDEAIIALCKDVGEKVPAFDFPEGAWTDGPTSADGTRPFVTGFFEYWDRHRAVLWSRNVAVNEGDTRFVEIRNRSFEPMVRALATRIELAQDNGMVDPAIAPMGLSCALAVMLDRIGMMSPKMVEPWGESADELVDAVAYIFDRALGVKP